MSAADASANRVLISWIGTSDEISAKKSSAETDPEARKAVAEKDPGPILRLLRREQFDHLCLLDDLKVGDAVRDWLISQAPRYAGRITIYPSKDNLRNQYRRTYEFTRDQIKRIAEKDFAGARAYALLLSPGTPAAHVAMVLASQTLFNTEVKLYNTDDPSRRRRGADPDVPDVQEVDLGFSLRVDLDLPALQQLWQKDYLEDRMPLLAHYTHAGKRRGAKPFAGKRVLVVLHFLKNLLGFLEAARELGLDPALTTVFAKSYPYPSKQYVTAQLRKAGFEVRTTADIDARIDEFLQAHADKPLLVVEDGGFFAPRLIGCGGLGGRVIGVVEQTTRGYKKAKDALKRRATEGSAGPGFPIVPLTPSKLKAGFEPPHIGDAAVRAVQNMLSAYTLRTRKAAVIGCGSIGTALICALTSHGVPVSFYDKDPAARVNALNLCGLPAASIKEAVADADLIFGTTGETTIDREVIELIPPNAWLISVSSERVEIDLNYLRENARSSETLYSAQHSERSDFNVPIGTKYLLRTGKEVNVLADGEPVNFLGFGEMPDEAADLVMTLIFLAAAALAEGKFAGQTGLLDAAINQLVDEYRVCDEYLRLCRL